MHPVIDEIYAGLPKAGPGDDVYTVHAWTMLADVPPNAEVLDLGCGPGRQTLALASAADIRITAVDLHEPFLQRLGYEMHLRHLEKQITLMQADMNDLPFGHGSFDVIWSEGALYSMGFDNGLKSMNPLIRPGGWLVVTELCWLQPPENQPDELVEFWTGEYPGMQTHEENVKAIKSAGYELSGVINLPESAWWEGHYTLIEARLGPLKQKYADDSEASLILDMYSKEIEMYRKYSSAFGYVFYMMRKP